jgi:guanine deaminase
MILTLDFIYREFLMPGLIDTHIHAPQYPNIGLGYDKALLEWLETYTFPLECQYGDTKFAAKVYEAVVVRFFFSFFY